MLSRELVGRWNNGTAAAWDLSTAVSQDQILTFFKFSPTTVIAMFSSI